MSNENDKGLGPIEAPIPGEDARLPNVTGMSSLAESKQRAAATKTAIGEVFSGGQGNPKPTKKSRKKLIVGIVSGVAAIALVAGGVTFGAAQTRISNYTNAVDDQASAIKKIAKAATDLTAADKTLAEATEAHKKGYLADLKVAATAPEALVSVKTNAPVVALTTADTKAASEKAEKPAKAKSKKTSDKDALTPVLPTYEELKAAGDKITSERVADAQAEAKAATADATNATAKVDAVTAQINDLATEVFDGANAMAPAATEALKNKKAWVEAYAKADAADLNKKATALEKALAAYEKVGEPSNQADIAITTEMATSFTSIYADFLKSATTLKASHDALVAAEAQAAADAAAAQAAAEAAAQQPQWVDPGYSDWGSNGGGGSWSNGNAGSGGGGNAGSGGGGSGSGGGSNGGSGGEWTPPVIPPQPCEATGTCQNPNI